MPGLSAGILMYRRAKRSLEVLLVHPGGPFWRNKDVGAWSIPKGEFEAGENPAEAARREFLEELGCAVGQPLSPLGEIRQRGGKRVIAFAAEGNWTPRRFRATHSKWNGLRKAGGDSFPEVDRAEWFTLPVARTKILQGQLPLLDRLHELASHDSRLNFGRRSGERGGSWSKGPIAAA